MMLLKEPEIRLLDDGLEDEKGFQEGIDIICKMARLGPRQDQDEGDFEDEMMSTIRAIYSVMNEISDDVLYSAFKVNLETITKCKNTFAANHVMQDMCDFSEELYERGYPKAYEEMYWFCKRVMFDFVKNQNEYYEAVVDAFFISQECDEGMPDGFYDRSYVTEENQDFPDIYYLRIMDYYAEKIIAISEQGIYIDNISEYKECHELYLDFLKTAASNDEHLRMKELRKIYGKSIKKRKHSIIGAAKRECMCLPIANACYEIMDPDRHMQKADISGNVKKTDGDHNFMGSFMECVLAIIIMILFLATLVCILAYRGHPYFAGIGALLYAYISYLA